MKINQLDTKISKELDFCERIHELENNLSILRTQRDELIRKAELASNYKLNIKKFYINESCEICNIDMTLKYAFKIYSIIIGFYEVMIMVCSIINGNGFDDGTKTAMFCGPFAFISFYLLFLNDPTYLYGAYTRKQEKFVHFLNELGCGKIIRKIKQTLHEIEEEKELHPLKMIED